MTAFNYASKLRQSRRLLRTIAYGIGMLLVMATVTACVNGGSNGSTPASTGTTSPGNGSMTTAPIKIQTVNIITAESYPPQIFVEVTGIIPDSCTTAREPQVAHDGSAYTITIIGERPSGVMCAQIVSTYKHSIPLGSPSPGQYTVSVNDITKDFTVS